ncbi:MAG TPA: VWA domain-containing protein [Pyrinomonadaceae bacterium]|nr:VWA domain-containing protein [Pyrinomonadaceae bacterium]
MKLNAILSLLLLFCLFPTVPAQTNPAPPPPAQKPSDDDDVVRITTNLVQVDAIVTKDGKVVPNLTADDFELYEDGKKQAITSFAYISNVPTATAEPPSAKKEKPTELAPAPRLNRDDARRTVALVVDDLGLSAESMHNVRRQLRKFIAEELQPNDLVAVMRTSGELGALQQFTNDRRVLDRAVERLRWNMCSRAGVSVIPIFDPTRDQYEDPEFGCGANSYYKTLKSLRFILDAMGQLPGRKSMVLLSDSLPAESQEVKFENEALNTGFNTTRFTWVLQRIAEKAIRSSVVIYSVDTQGLQYTGLTPADQPRLTRGTMNARSDIMTRRSDLLWRRREGGELIAKQTGGFQVRNSNSFDLPRILQDQNGYYLLGYRPTNETFNRRFHHIKAKVKRSGLTLRTRFGFFGVSEEELGPGPAQLMNPTSTNLALRSPFGAQDIEVSLVSFFTNDKVSGSMIRSFVYIDPRGLTFEMVDGQRQASFELHGVIFGDNGIMVEQTKDTATLRLTDRDYEHAMRNGMALKLDMPVKKPGSYQVRFAARDRNSAKIGSSGQFVEVPDLNKKRMAVSGIVLGATAGSSGRDVNEILQRPATRNFDPNTDLHFAFVTYNAPSTSNLVMEAKLFRDGKAVFSGPETPINIGNQADPSRLLVNGSLRLSSDLELGNYYLQVVITDKAAKSKTAPVVQWIDFDIVR